MSTIATVLAVLLSLAFLGGGASKLAGAKQSVTQRDELRLSPGQWLLIGLVEMLGGGLLLAGAITDDADLARVGAGVIAVTMLGAVGYHAFRMRDPVAKMVPAGVLLVLAAVVGAAA